MQWIIVSIDKGEVFHHRITAANIEEAIQRGKTFLKGMGELIAVINAKHENKI